MSRGGTIRVLLCAAGVLLPRADAREPAWQTQALPPEAEHLNREAAAAGDAAAAARLYAQSLRTCASNGTALYGLGRALLDQDRGADARLVLRRLAAAYPEEPAAREALAFAVARLPAPRRADIAEGRAGAEAAVRLDPGAPEAWHLLSVLRHLDGDYPAAAEAARQAVELDAQQPVDPETTARYQQQETACTDACLVFSPLD